VIADNRLALDAGWDEEMLALELAELSERVRPALTGFEDAEIEALLTGEVTDAGCMTRSLMPTNRGTMRPTTCRMRPSWRCRAPAMSGPSARTA
jgi:hypothetical protein